MGFEWDERKREANIQSHGVDFVRAAKMFVNPVLERIDDREDYGEKRLIALGHWKNTLWSRFTRGVVKTAGLFRRGKQVKMKEKHILKQSMDEIMEMKDRTRPDAPESPLLDTDFWKEANVVRPEGPKKQITVRLDADMVEWFKRQGRGYQTRMNAVLRSYYETYKNAS